MPIIESSYRPPKFFKNGHIQTIYPFLFRTVKAPNFETIRLDTPDNDFIDFDYYSKDNPHLVILSHGLEGSSRANYIQGMAKKLHLNFDVIAWSYRSCSGEMNKQKKFYSIYDYSDLELIIDWGIKKGYKKISLIGFSMGGNLTACYLGNKSKQIPPELCSSILFSSPFDLKEAANNLSNWHFGKVYSEAFLSTMRKKIKEKHELIGLPEINTERILKVKSFKEFDDLYTAPVHGFKRAEDFYYNASSVRVLDKIQLPTLIINAANDPFLSGECYPEKIASISKNIILEVPTSGGHVGFLDFSDDSYWSEKRALGFLNLTA